MAKLLKREKPLFNCKHRERLIKLLQQPFTCKMRLHLHAKRAQETQGAGRSHLLLVAQCSKTSFTAVC